MSVSLTKERFLDSCSVLCTCLNLRPYMKMIVISKDITEHLSVILIYFSVKYVSSASKSVKVVTFGGV